MLYDLHIENIAVIQRADVEFEPGFNVLTGETGAGKSIVIDAIDAVLGGRTSRELVRSGTDRAMVSATFSADNTESWCEENGIEPEDGTLVLLRRISADGRGACRVNGAAVTVSQLRELGGLLLNIHGQNDGRQLMDESRHRGYLDAFGGLDGMLAEYRAAYRAYRDIEKEMERLNLDEIEKARLQDSLSYQIDELEKAELRPGESDELSQRRDLLRNAGKLSEAVDGALDALYDNEYSAVSMAGEAAGLLDRVSALSPEMESAEKNVNDALFMLEDAAETLRDFKSSLDFSPEEYDALENRLSALRRLFKKYGGDETDLLARLDECRVRLDEIQYAEDSLIKLEKKLEKQKAAVLKLAEKLTGARKDAAARLQKRVQDELRELNMPSVRFETEMEPLETELGFDANGADRVRFLMSANAGETPGRISRIASGGELSRIMLALKSVFAENDAVPSMVFDEIDTGVSGVAAQRVGEKIAALALDKQVLCITHLPQIAAMADAHYLIQKAEQNGRTFTNVTRLDRDGRKMELARLHGGDNITATTLQSAQEQLDAADKYKRERKR